MSKNILITGGAGFIGSNFINYFINKYPKYNLIVLDKLTYAANIKNLDNVIHKIIFIKGDICDFDLLNTIFSKYKIDSVINFAAETHVDNSIKNPLIFTQTNVIGTNSLLEVSRQFWKDNYENKFLQISTDEVYGTLSEGEKPFTENTPLKPNSPYSASKASADLLVMAYIRTFGLPATISRCSNNYGPYQFPEKLIPVVISKALNDEPIPVYGTGENVRDWIHVHDHNVGVDLILREGKIGEVYNLGGHSERTNLEVVKTILKQLGKPESLITFVSDRPGHDRRYAIDSSKVEKELHWDRTYNFEDGMKETIDWYVNNQKWIDDIKDGSYQKAYNKN